MEKAHYVYVISRNFPFHIGRVITKHILERIKRSVNTALRFPSLITELCLLSQVPMAGNEEKTLHPYPFSVKGIKSQSWKSVRGQPSRDMPGDGSRRDELDEEGEANEEDEDAKTEGDKEEANEMPPLGHQGKLILQSVGDMFHNHN